MTEAPVSRLVLVDDPKAASCEGDVCALPEVERRESPDAEAPSKP